jgi:hypothetical protein
LEKVTNFKRKERETLSFPKNPFDPLTALEFFLSFPGKLTVDTILISIRRKQSASYDPFYDGWPILYGHLQFASFHENRERSCGDVYVVEMCASFKKNLLFQKFDHDYRAPSLLPVKGDANLGKKGGKIALLQEK